MGSSGPYSGLLLQKAEAEAVGPFQPCTVAGALAALGSGVKTERSVCPSDFGGVVPQCHSSG